MASRTGSTTTPIARKISTIAAMRTVLANGPISRADIAKLTGLSKRTVSEVVLDLIADGWLRDSGRTDGRRLLSERLEAPLTIENDVDVAARGEQWRGHGTGLDNFVFGAPVPGARGAAG